MSRPFTALYAGKCADCGEWVTAGETIRFGPDGIVHNDCDDAPDPLAIVGPVCDQCWLTKPCEHDT